MAHGRLTDIYYQCPSWLQHLLPQVTWRGNRCGSCVYLTFDDGPVPEVTPQVLDILDKYAIRATFFWVGENVYRYPDLAREVCRRGHRIALHTFNHLSGWKTPYNRYCLNCGIGEETVQRVLGSSWDNRHLFRPPYGRVTLKQLRWLRQRYQVVMWDLITHDYDANYSPDMILHLVQRLVRPGSILLFHDSKKSATNVLAALPKVIDYLQQQGFAFCVLG